MKKFLLPFIALSLHAHIIIPQNTQQLLVVSSEGFDNSRASLDAYEKRGEVWQKALDTIEVTLGRNGLAWGEGLKKIQHNENEPIKYEGDGKSPAGLFTLESFFGYNKREFSFPYLQVEESTLCIDDSDSPFYNQIIQTRNSEEFKSFEYMKREDKLYSLGVVVGHNKGNLKKRGSCIFIHIAKQTAADIASKNPHILPTAGCTAMQEERLLKLMKWLDKSKRPLLLQLPKAYLQKGFK